MTAPFSARDLEVLAATLLLDDDRVDASIQEWIDEHVRTVGDAGFLISCLAHTTAELLVKLYPQIGQERDAGAVFMPEAIDPTNRASVASGQILAAAMAQDGDMVAALANTAARDPDTEHIDMVIGHAILGLASALRQMAKTP